MTKQSEDALIGTVIIFMMFVNLGLWFWVLSCLVNSAPLGTLILAFSLASLLTSFFVSAILVTSRDNKSPWESL